jgi:hypothetical protein
MTMTTTRTYTLIFYVYNDDNNNHNNNATHDMSVGAGAVTPSAFVVPISALMTAGSGVL